MEVQTSVVGERILKGTVDVCRLDYPDPPVASRLLPSTTTELSRRRRV